MVQKLVRKQEFGVKVNRGKKYSTLVIEVIGYCGYLKRLQ